MYRAAVDAAGQARLNPSEWKALNGVMYFTVSYGKATDRVTTLRIAQHVGIYPESDDRVRMRETGRALRGLRDKTLIVYEPGRQGTASLVGVHPTVLARVWDSTPDGVSIHTPKVSDSTPQGVSPHTKQGVGNHNLPRRTSQEVLPRRASAASGGALAPNFYRGSACPTCGATSDPPVEQVGALRFCGDCDQSWRAA